MPRMPRRRDDLGLGGQAAGERVRRLGDVVEAGRAPAQHLGQVQVGRGADHLVVEPVFHQRPPEIGQERPETGRGPVQRDAVGEDAVQVGVRIHEAGREGLAGRVDDLILRVRLAQLGVGRDGDDLIRLRRARPSLASAARRECQSGNQARMHAWHRSPPGASRAARSVGADQCESPATYAGYLVACLTCSRRKNRPPPDPPTNSPSCAITRPRSIVSTG